MLSVTGQLWSISTTSLQVRLRIQLNSILFAKTLVRKDIASSSANSPNDESKKPKATSANTSGDDDSAPEKLDGEEDFSSKAQIMTLMTTDVDRVSEFSWHLFAVFGKLKKSLHVFLWLIDWFAHTVDAPVEIVVGTIFLYNLLGKLRGILCRYV